MAAVFARRVLIVDDEPIIRNLIAERLQQLGFEVQTAADALSAKRTMLRFDPDALIVDLDLGDGPSGTELIAALHELNPALGFLLLSNYVPTPAELSSASHVAYLNKREVTNIQKLIDALDSVLRLENPGMIASNPESRLAVLTKNQLEILGLLAKGLSNSEIAQKRNVSTRAVEQAIFRIYNALNLQKEPGSSRRVSAARIFASEMGLRRETK